VRQPLVAVVVSAHTDRRWRCLERCVDSLRHQSRRPDEVIVVIDHNPELLERARMALNDIRVIENIHGRGAAGARNSGVAASSAHIVAFIDDDAWAAPDWLRQLLAPYADADVVAVGGRIDPVWEAGRPAWFPGEFHWIVGCSYLGLPNQTAVVRNLISCNMSVLRQALLDIGGFRSDFSGLGRSQGSRLARAAAGIEDTEVCISISRARPTARILHEPGALVHHSVTRDRIRFSYFARRCYFEGFSKAQLAVAVGHRDGLSCEIAYAFITLPKGMVRGFLDLFRGHASGPARSAAIVVGLLITTWGYLVGRLRYPRGLPARPRHRLTPS